MAVVENKIIKNKTEAMAMQKHLLEQELIACDTETTGFAFWKDSIIGFSFSSDKCNYYLPVGESDDLDGYACVQIVTPIFKSYIDKVFHNGKFDLKFIKMLDIEVNGKCHDTMIQAHILDENRKSKKLKDLGVQYVDKHADDDEAVIKTYFREHKLENYGQIPTELLGPYACKDTELTLALHHIFYPEVQESFQLVYDNEIYLQNHLVDMEMKGVLIDVEYLNNFQEDCEKRLLVIQKEIFKLAGHTFNINSTDELSVVLYDELKLPPKDFSAKTGKATVDKYTLEKLKDKHDIITPLMEYRGLAKLTSTYIKGILDKVVRGNRIHADFQQVGTRTGRLSCWSPNLHNIPRGDSIRKAFLNPHPAEAQLLFFDYSQIEFRMVAHYSKDPIMMEGFQTGVDFHTWTGMKLFNIPANALDKEQRIRAKQINFGILYGMGKRTLASILKVNEGQASKFLNDYYDTFPALRPFVSAAKQAVRTRGFIKNFVGRYRRLNAGENYKAVNALAQGSAADVLKIAIVKVGDYLRTKKSYMVMNVHDELIIVHYLVEPEVIKEVKHLMENFEFRVPIKVEIEYSKTSWGEKEKL